MAKPLRVLVVEDSEDDTLLLVRELRSAGYEPSWRRVERAEDMRAALDTETWDLVVSDYTMPQFSGPEALQVLTAAGIDVPFLIVSGTVGEDVAVEAMRAGAHDYLLKGQLKRLAPAIERELRQAASRRAGRRAEEQYRDLVASAPIGIYKATREGAFVTVNAAYARLLGYDDPEDILRLDLRRDIYFDDADRERLIAELERHGGVAASEVRLKRRDGSPVWVRQVSRSVLGRSGEVEFFEDFVHDIQKQKAAETALRQSEERFRRSFTVSPVGMSLSEASTGRFIDVNERFAETFGYRREELIGRTSLEVGLWADPEQRERTMRMTRRGSPIRGREVRMRARSGEIRHVLGSLEPLELGQERIFLAVFQDITERKRDEESIRRLLGAVEQAGSVIYMTDSEGTITYVNPAFERTYGYSKEELLGQTPRILKSGVHEEDFYQSFWKRLLAGESVREEFVNRRRDGQLVTVEAFVSPVLDAENERIGFIAVQEDVTERKRAEEALKTSEARFRSYFTLGLIGMAITSLTKGWLEVNDELCRILGYGRDELSKKTWSEMTHPDDLAADEASFARVLAGEIDGYSLEKRWIRKDGRIIDSVISVRCVRAKDGSVDHFIALLHDITDRKRAQQESRKNEERFRRLLDANTIGIAVADLTGRTLEANDRYLEIIGCSREELLAGTIRWDEITPPELKSRDQDAVAELQRTGVAQPWEKEFLRKDGSRVPVLIGVAMLGESEGSVIAYFVDLTEQRRAEEALRQSEERFRQSFSVSPVAMALSHPATGLILDANEGLAGMLGYERDELLGRSSLELGIWTDPHQRERVASDLEASIPIREREVELRTKTGDIRHVLYSVEPVDIGNERVILSAFNDVTERRQAEQALRDSEERYRLLFESNPQPMWVFDVETLAFLAVNDAACRHYGYSRDEFLSMTIREIRPAEDVPVLLSQMAHERREYQESGLWRHRKRDGSIIEVEITSHPLVFDGRQAELVLVNDVTERRHAERRERQRTMYLNALVENSPLAILVLDDEHRIQIANPAFRLLFGYSAEELLGRNPDDLISPMDDVLREEVAALTRESLAGRPVHISTKRRRKDGKLVEVDFYGVPLTDAGRLIGVYAIYQDVSERNQLEIQLQQAQKMEAVGQLAGGVAHDFNNVLTAILGYSDLLAMQLGEGSPMLESVDEIRRAGERAASLTRQLLAFSRRQVLEPRVLDPNELMRNVEKMLRRLIGEDVALATRLDPSIGRMRADPGQVEQVLLNLAVNARDAMPRGGTLTIETQNAELDESYAQEHVTVKPGSYVMIAATDTGTGMDAEVKAHIFEPFFTTKEKGKGTGLGLATVYGIVKQSGGYIWVYSEPGHGTAFKIYFPRVESPAERLSRKEAQRTLRGTETILLVEDELPVRRLARAILESHGYAVLEADGAERALELVQHHSGALDLLLTDVVMPKMGGSDLAMLVHGLRPEVKVLYMSGYTDDAIVRQGLVAEGSRFLQKPFTPDALAAKVRDVLDS